MLKQNSSHQAGNTMVNYSLFEPYQLIHFTTTRAGGVSKGNYSEMNLSLYSNDSKEDVIENRKRLASYAGVPDKHLFIPFQTHDDVVRVIDHTFLSLTPSQQEKELHGVDALITQQRNICIAVTTADCVPILMYDPVNHALGVAHAGWKGTVAQIGAKMALKMQEEFLSNPAHLIVGIGPSISKEMFEVGNEVGKAFIDAGFSLSSLAYRNAETGKLHIDLWQANKEQLLHLGVLDKNIEVVGKCTFQDETFFSARRQTINSGRMATGGVLRNTQNREKP